MGPNALIKTRQLTDDDIDDISDRLYDWLERHPLWVTEEGYDHFKELVQQTLEPYSNGYRNFN